MKRDPRLRIQVPEVERGVRWRHLRRVPAQQRVEQHRRAEWLGDRTFDTRTVVLTLVTTYGVKNNAHAQRLGLTTVTMDALFKSP